MKITSRIVILILLIVILGLLYMVFPDAPVPGAIISPGDSQSQEPGIPGDGEPVFCTADAMMCPDGTFVGRTGPDCQFVCPDVSATTTAATTTDEQSTSDQSAQIILSLGQEGDIGGFSIAPLRVEEDSRCPSDVVCIQAGTVRLSLAVQVIGSDSAQVTTISLGTSLTIDGHTIILQEVQPHPTAGTLIGAGQYRFVFGEE